MSLKPRPKLPDAPSIKADIPVVRRRAILRARQARLVKDLTHYGALFQTPLIEAQRAEWKAELALVMSELVQIEQATKPAQS